MNRVIVPGKKGKNIVDLEKITYCEADGKYSRLYLDNENSILITLCLKELENRMLCNCFVRIHYKFLLNIAFIKEISINGRSTITLINNVQLPVANRRKKKVLQNISNFYQTL